METLTYRRILVALDGSAVAERVLPHVELLARQFGSSVLLLRAVTPPERLVAATAEVSTGIAVDQEPLLEAEEAEREEAQSYLQRTARRLAAQGLSVTVESPEADAATVMVGRAREIGADLIAMTTHGRGGLGRLVFGSVADAVLRSAPCPVLLVRVHEEA
jgi:nucleotide-binding universal stress UspA family protein